ncbi:MAG: hypothetical protein KGS45_13215 [Planctomycetes bacterium]|nr:hypothetical protein [Planctomycetota bacterium]
MLIVLGGFWLLAVLLSILVKGAFLLLGGFVFILLVPVAALVNWILAASTYITFIERNHGRLRQGDLLYGVGSGLVVGVCTAAVLTVTIFAIGLL